MRCSNNVANVRQRHWTIPVFLVKHRLRSGIYLCLLTSRNEMTAYLCVCQFLQSFSSLRRKICRWILISKLNYRVICYPLFCTSLVPVTFFANLFSAPLRSPPLVFNEPRLGTLFLFLCVVNTRFLLPEPQSLRYYAPDSSCLYRYRTRSALTCLR